MPHRTDPSRRAGRRPVTDRWAFKPVALILLAVSLLASGVAAAVIVAPPFLAAGLGIRELDRRLDEAGAEFTRIPRFPQRSTIYANDGKTVLAQVYLDNREIVDLKDVSPAARRAVLAIEDSDFYEHGAIDWRALSRAAIENFREGGIVQGGSTISQQLVKNTLGLDPSDQSLERKFQELALALRVEERYSKNKILSMYLNQVYLGNNVYGIGTASQFYFDKPAADLTVREGALLAGMIRAPAYYDPLERPRKAKLRRNDVLNRMESLGWLDQEWGDHIERSDLGLAESVGEFRLPKPPFIVDFVKQQLIDDPHGWYGDVLGETPEDRERSLKEGGLDIVTTLDPELQQKAQAAADLPWARTPAYPDHDPPADLGIVTVDVPTGALVTMLSGKNYFTDEIDTVTTPHQPGSSFKPYVLAAAFLKGIPPTATYSGSQAPITDPRCVDAVTGAPWQVYNAEGYSAGYLDLYTATADSVNGVFARLILDAGLPETVEIAHAMGVQSELQPVCALATGSVDVSPLDQASGYQTIANRGVHCVPYGVARISRDDQPLYIHRPDCARVLPKVIADLITQLLVGVVEHGTVGGYFNYSWGDWPVAGKTGTGDENKNVWFVGFTQQYATAVWVGSQGNPYDLGLFFGGEIYGSTVAAPVWKAYMVQVMDGLPALEFREPTLATVPRVIGLPEEEAIAVLKEARFKVTTQAVGSYLPAGTVAEQNPAGGALTLPRATVVLGISNGIPPTVKMPVVWDLTTEEAVALLTSLHLFVEFVEAEVDDPELVGQVLVQTPKPGTILEEGSTVILKVGIAPPEGGGGGHGGGGGPPTPTPTPTPIPSPTPSPSRLRRG